MRTTILLAFLASGCAALSEKAENPGTCVAAGATRVLATDVDPEVPIQGIAHADGMTIVYESDVFGRTALEVDPELLTVRSRHRVDPMPVSGPNALVRLKDPKNPAVAFVAVKDDHHVLAIAPIVCAN